MSSISQKLGASLLNFMVAVCHGVILAFAYNSKRLFNKMSTCLMIKVSPSKDNHHAIEIISASYISITMRE